MNHLSSLNTEHVALNAEHVALNAKKSPTRSRTRTALQLLALLAVAAGVIFSMSGSSASISKSSHKRGETVEYNVDFEITLLKGEKEVPLDEATFKSTFGADAELKIIVKGRKIPKKGRSKKSFSVLNVKGEGELEELEEQDGYVMAVVKYNKKKETYSNTKVSINVGSLRFYKKIVYVINPVGGFAGSYTIRK